MVRPKITIGHSRVRMRMVNGRIRKCRVRKLMRGVYSVSVLSKKSRQTDRLYRSKEGWEKGRRRVHRAKHHV
jgi:hypothetical protein